MRTDNWPMDRIMRLPDWCFGRRYWLGAYLGATNGRYSDAFAEGRLPDKFVVWAVKFSCHSPACLEAMRFTIRLINMLGIAPAGLATCERLFKNISRPGIMYEFYVKPNGQTWIDAGRQIIESQGRRIGIGANGDQTIAYQTTAGVQISALPKEVPDWLCLKEAEVS